MREREASERELLLQTKFTTNADTSDTSIMIDRALEHGNALNRSNR